MKNRPLKHKTGNAFQFKPFSERIAEIDIRRGALYHVEHENEVLEEDQTYFHQTVKKWKALNLSEEYQRFQVPIQNIVTLPQLLHKKSFIMEHLLQFLDEATSHSLQPILELVVVLAKDLREEFSPHFMDIFDKLIELLNTKDPDQLEWTFLCLAFLFKIQRGFLRRILNTILDRIVNLLDDHKPVHINNFAAECFSFIARDVKNKRDLVLMIVKASEENPAAITGSGRLIFEIMRGVNHQFHSCARQFWQLLLSEVTRKDADISTNFDSEVLFRILVQSVTDMVEYIGSNNLQPFWEAAYESISTLLADTGTNSKETALQFILHLIGIVFEHHRGKDIEIAPLIALLVKIINRVQSEQTLSCITKIVTIMMQSKHINITHLEASRLTKNIMRVGPSFKSTFEEFVLNVVDYSMFDSLILPDYLNYFESSFDAASLQFLSRIVMRRAPMNIHGMSFSQWRQFPLQLKNDGVKNQLIQLMKERQYDDNEFQLCLILLPHLKDINCEESVNDFLERQVKSLLRRLVCQFETQQCFVLGLLIQCLVHLDNITPDIYARTVNEMLLVISSTKRESLIKIVNLCLVKLHHDKQAFLNDNFFDNVHGALREFLGSPHHETRLIVTHSFALFSHLNRFHIRDETQTLFEILHAIEAIEPSVHNYRQQIMLLKKLEFDSKLIQNISNESLRLDAMRFVLSLFSVNFKLLWEPAEEVLKTYAEALAVDDFWNLYKWQLNLVLEAITCKGSVMSSTSTSAISDSLHVLQNIEIQFWSIHETTDYVNYRVKLLTALLQFNRIFEAKNRDLVGSFFNFIDTEYRIRQACNNESGVNQDTPKATQKILIAYLNIFIKMKNLKTISKSNELYDFFLELITHNSSEVRKLALDCLFAYKNSAIVSYKENLHRLNSDQMIKQEMQTFFKEDLSMESKLGCIVLDEHRAQVVPLVLKILHTKLTQKGTPLELKSLMLRFIGNFDEEEVNLFVSMTFGYFESMLKSNPLETFHFISNCTRNFEEDLPVHRLQILVNFIDSIREELAGSKDITFIRRLLHLKLCMDSVLLRMDHSLVKSLKSRTISSLEIFFEHFENYEWNTSEIEAVFRIYVWPQLAKFESECLHSPTPLLKLFICWSNNPRYHALFAKPNTDSGSPLCSTPLEHTINLLCSDKASDSINQEISKIITNLLILETHEQISSVSLTPSNILAINDYVAEKKFSLGTSLLMPFFSSILSHLERTIMRKRSISKAMLYILSNLAVHMKSGENGDVLFGMLLQITTKKVTLQHLETETIRQLHSTLLLLMKHLDQPEKYIRQLGILLERVRDLVARRTICQMINLIAEKSNNARHVKCAYFVSNMNKMDKRWLDQPDYERQLRAFRELDKQITEENVPDIDLSILMAHQCFYYLKTDKDLAIRDNASQCLRKLTIATIKQFGTNKNTDASYFVERIILNALMKGIKDKDVAVRNENIQLLGDLCRECSLYGTIFADLHPFTNSQDREIDFFDNITHLQVHRHRRAMNRFCQVARKLTTLPSTRSLVHFVLPIVSSYLCNEKYRKKFKLTEAAGNCVVTIARMLPWSNYKVTLKYYVNRMKQSLEYQKQLIKLVVALLDNFHYDLSRADTASLLDTTTTVNATLATESSMSAESSSELDQDDVVVDNLKRDEPSTETNIISFQSRTALDKHAATIVTKDITSQLIPDLLCAFNYKETPIGIKLNERKVRYQREKEEMLKIPIAIAITKLLQMLPSKFMDLIIPKLMIKVISFLKSNLKQVRNIARETLKSIMETVGPMFLQMTIENLASILKRGFQVHVLIVTVHTILDALKEQLTPAYVDDILHVVVDMCINDIFGLISEEKCVTSVTSKTPEAKPSRKSFLTLQILAKNMSEKSTLGILMPFNKIVSKASSRKVITNVEEALSKIADGICTNPNITIESILILVHGLTSESIPDLLDTKKSTTKQEDAHKRAISDTYIIAREPKRRGTQNQIVSLTNTKTNAHVFIEMGLEILLTCIKRNQVLLKNYEAFLEPLIPTLVNSMNSIHTKMSVLSIKCICSIWSSKLDLSKMQENIVGIVDNILKTLHKYATAVISRNDENFLLVKCSFRAMVALIKFVKKFTISTEQLTTLLLYVEQDLYNSEKNTISLILLRSIVGAKLVVPEMAIIMKKVSELSIINDSSKIREHCRQIVLEYMMNYSLGNIVSELIQFYISQLEYEDLFGRESAVLLLHAVIRTFPQVILNEKASLFFLTIGIRLVNEESNNCRKMIAECIENLLSRLDKSHSDELFELILEILQNKSMKHRELAAQLVIRMINVERSSFLERTDKLFPILLATVTDVECNNVGKFVRLKPIHSLSEDTAEQQKVNDHALLQSLNAFHELFEICPEVLTNAKFHMHIDELSYCLQSMLSHGHQWVRNKALNLLSKVLRTVDIGTVYKSLNKNSTQHERKFIYSNPLSEIKSLVLDMCTQLTPIDIEEDIIALVAENLLIIANILKVVPMQTYGEQPCDVTSDGSKSINLLWLIRRIRYVIQNEVSKAPKSTALRKHLFQWMEAVVELLDVNVILKLTPSMISPVIREISDEDHLDENVKEIALRLSRKIKTKIGDERFDKIHLNVLSSVQTKRVARQRAIAMEKISNPILASERKASIKIRKNRLKKRKRENLNDDQISKKQITKGKRRRLEDLFQ